MRRLFIGVCLMLAVFLCSCVQNQTIEELGIVSTSGIDNTGNDVLEETLVFFNFTSSKKGQQAQFVTSDARTLNKTRQNANYKTRYQLTTGSLKTQLIGRETATIGLIRIIDPYVRDAKASDQVYLAVSDTTAKELITKANENPSVKVGRYFKNIIKQKIKGNIIQKITIQDFLRFYYDAGVDPVLPMFALVKDKIALSDLAIFKGDKMVGHIPLDKSYLINMFHQTVRNLNVEFTLPLQPFEKFLRGKPRNLKENKFYATLQLLKGKAKTKLLDKQQLHFQTEINIDADLVELTEDLNMQDPKSTKILEREMEKSIKQQYEKLLANLQKVEADPFGLGVIYRINKTSGKLKESEWRAKFPDVTVDFHVNVSIKNHGTIS